MISKGDYWLGLEPIYHILNGQQQNGENITYGLDIDIWTVEGQHYVARYNPYKNIHKGTCNDFYST